LLDHLKQLPNEERAQELGKIRHCAVSALLNAKARQRILIILDNRDGFL
jgi:hypothetical protein